MTERVEEFPVCLSHCSIAVRRHHDKDKSRKTNHLIGGWLTVSETYSIIIMAGTMVLEQ